MLRRMLLATFVAFFVGAYGAYASTSVGRPLTAAEKSDLRHMFDSLHGKKGLINLADPVNERAYYRLLEQHGLTPQNRPQFFAALQRTKRQQAATLAAGKALDDNACTGAVVNQLQHVYDLVGVDANGDFTNVNVDGLDSIYKGADSYVDTLDVYDSDGDPIASGTAEPQGDDGKFRLFHTTEQVGPPNNPSGEPVRVGGTFTYIKDGASTGPCGFDLAKIHGVPKAIAPGAPQYVNNTPQTAASGVIICLNRSNSDGTGSTCDYGPMYDPHVANSDTHVLTPISGSVTYYDPLADGTSWQDSDTTDYPTLYVIPRGIGGGCKLSLIDNNNYADFWSHFQVSQDRKTLTYKWDKADFGLLCYQLVGPYATWDFIMTFFVKTKSGNSTYNVQAVITSNNQGNNIANSVAQIYPLQFQYGCILKGTLITMADGSRKKIELVRSGDVVRSKGGQNLRVKHTVIGTDSELVHIVDQRGGSLFVTPAHPIPTARGMLEARQLRRGDTIYTLAGSTTVREAKAEVRKPGVQVYNLDLEQTDGKPLATPQDRVFYAAGVLVGDNEMQAVLGRKALENH
ncbi:Hint domain-containing protein [Burkholderia dolosa]|jgi:hypothetical protein|uniref:Hint domain-containing protein n=1 Tax=Burkholderia dolosa TaxID=152500 RepID=UPI0015928F40|nr:Hint domain-containing protein [Burkholderia dolosa]MBY4753438.1 hypothetical protein [Burkholderia dolosa]